MSPRRANLAAVPAPEAEDDPSDVLLTPGEVALLFRVTPKTVTRWAEAGKLPAIRTLGGHRRFRVADVDRVRAEVASRLRPALR
ncbi:BldC family transcriptional regulator [Aquihabitans sp. G128]|uniref:BldC family transcriptional regulator n=1 Tax=Aquihabitans sp. G128 TaxID=2849779 RepID=UPI001C245FDF|nr:BldC family transcriptional regulator [Aquihabitans sp. G128]QXC59966.1 BldC family transcriptional regulator [Aquihabitans sp. G128]